MKKSVPGSPYLLHFISTTLLLAGCNFSGLSQTIDFGKSYVNVTKGLNGGTVEPGDTLEIRASFVVRSGTFDSCAYYDAVPAGTAYIPGTIRVLTNEGKIYKQFTDAVFDDPGWISGATVRINLGYNAAAAPATAARRGRVANTHKPSFYGSTCIMIASFRVRVTAVLGSNISTGGGSMTYKNGLAALQTFTFPANTLRVYQNLGICSNTIGANAIGTEFNGTFGSGRPRNRGTSGNVPVGYTYSHFITNGPNDYYYGIANNTSVQTGYSTSNLWAKPDPDPDGAGPLTTHRVFQVWDIIGDHTGAVSPTAGNPASDTVVNANAGYMLVINAAYRIDSAFQQTISGLCPNTYYEISCWMRNICSKCGCDSNGKGASNTSGPVFYIPTAAGDSSGVYPNITFEVDGIDYFTTGNIRYTGQWIKKGFTFLTGPAQTSFTLKFFNNAPGGGGNDWALDDIAVSTCSPNMKYSPSLNPTVCLGNVITLRDTVRSFFNNYTYYKWQRSTNGGASWTDVTPASGPASPFWNGAEWEYVSSYTVPPAFTTLADDGDLYRLVVATTLANLSNVNCNFTDGGNIVTLDVIDCSTPLNTDLLSFSGSFSGALGSLQWTTSAEEEPLSFEIEKSADGNNFLLVDTLNSYQNYTSAENTYRFTDPEPLPGIVYYRILMKNKAGKSKYSRIIQLPGDELPFAFVQLVNPFDQQLSFSISSGFRGQGTAELIHHSGKQIIFKQLEIKPGINPYAIANTGVLAPGMYVLRIQCNGFTLQKRVLKLYH
jgi:hypothetical protein